MVHFENLIDNLEWNLLRILDFLDFESDQQRLQCVLRNAEGQFHRRAKNSTMRWGNQIKFGDSGLFTFLHNLFKNSIMFQFFDCKIQSFRVFETHNYLFWIFQIWLDSHLISQTSDDPYNDSQKKLIREAVRRVDQALKMSSMEAIPIHKYEFYRWWIWSSIMLNWDSRQSSRQNSIWVFVWLVFPIFWKQITAKKWSC